MAALSQASLQFTFLADGWVISNIGYGSLTQIALASLAAISCALVSNARINKVNQDGGCLSKEANSSSFLAVLGGVTATAAVWTAAAVVGFSTATLIAIAGLALPLGLVVLGFVFQEHLVRVVTRTAAAMSVSHMILLLQFLMTPLALNGQNRLLWVGISLGAATIHYLCSYLERKHHVAIRIGLNRFVCYGFLIAAISIVLSLLGLDSSLAIVSGPTILGLILIVVGQAAGSSVSANRNPSDKLAETRVAQWELVADYGRVFVMFANTAAMLWALNMLLTSASSLALTVAIGIQLAAAMLANLLSKTEGWKHGFISSAIVLSVTECLVVNEAIPFTIGTKAEFCAVLVGVMLLVIGHLSWAKESDSRSDSTTAALWFGSLLTAGPLLAALFCYRYFIDSGAEQFGHEIAVLATLLTLLSAGILCRIRSTTITGAAGMVIYVASLLTMIPLPEKLQSISVVMMVGGAIFFTTAILLSVYRDRIIAIPQRYRAGDGLFQVLKWR